MPIDAQSQRSAKILLNLSAGLDEIGKPFPDGTARLTSNLRLAASAGAAALGQLQGHVLATPVTDHPASPPNPVSADSAVARSQGQSASSAPADMVALPEWLDRLKQAKGFHADIALAEYLGISRHLFSQWRTGKTAPTTDEAWRIGLELGVSPLMVIACVAYQFSAREKRQVWLDLAGTLIPRAAVPATPQTSIAPAEASTAAATNPASPGNGRVASESGPGLEMQGTKWSEEQDALLIEDYQSLMGVPAIAAKHRRSIGAILYRLYRADQIPDDVMKGLCDQHGVLYRPKASVTQ